MLRGTIKAMTSTFTGANSYSLQAAVKIRVDEFLEEQGSDMGVERLDGDEVTIGRLSEALTSLPFLSSKKLVVIRNGSANKHFMERAGALLTEVPETTEVLIVESKLDKRSSYYKYLKKATNYQEFSEVDSGGLVRWLTARAKEQGGSLSQNDAAYLVGHVGNNQQLLASELEKLMLYAPAITRQTIDLLTESIPQSTIFELLEAAFAGNTGRAMALYSEQRALKVEPQQIVAMLTWQLHILALVKTGGERSPESIASEAKISPYVVKKTQSVARKLTLSKLKGFINNLVEIDRRSKREAYDINAALQYYILTLAA